MKRIDPEDIRLHTEEAPLEKSAAKKPKTDEKPKGDVAAWVDHGTEPVRFTSESSSNTTSAPYYYDTNDPNASLGKAGHVASAAVLDAQWEPFSIDKTRRSWLAEG